MSSLEIWQFSLEPKVCFFSLRRCRKRAARFETNCTENGSMTSIVEQLKWESLKKRRKNSELYKGLKTAASGNDSPSKLGQNNPLELGENNPPHTFSLSVRSFWGTGRLFKPNLVRVDVVLQSIYPPLYTLLSPQDSLLIE